MAKPDLNVAQVLSILFPGDSLERLTDELIDPGCHYSPGDRAKMSAAFTAVGEKIWADLQDEFAGVIEHTEGDTTFKWQGGGKESTRVNTDEVKKQYPEEEHPSLYYKTVTSGRVNIDLPFVKSRLDLPEFSQTETQERVESLAVPLGQESMDFPDFGGPLEPF